jgi:hypothetical protein
MRKFRIPIVGFFDFESVMREPAAPCSVCPSQTECYHSILIDAVQEACTYSLIVVDWRGEIVHSRTYSGHDCADQFVEDLLQIEPALDEMLQAYQPMHLTAAEERAFGAATRCHICEQPLLNSEQRHRDHCHLTGRFMGAAHAHCNMQREVVKKIPLFCHNFSGYDSHIVVKAMKSDARVRCLKALPRNTEKFRTIQLNNYHLLDSMSFLDGSLADVVEDLVRSNHPFSLLDKTDLCKTSEQKRLLLQKGVYPYEFATSVEQLRAARQLPPREAFFSKVANAGVGDDDYVHATSVFTLFGCRNMLDYCELYCRLDVLLLAECFLSFRAEVLQELDLDCCHYISLPQLAYDAMLKMTGVEIEPMTDIDMILFFESSIRGGVSFIGQRMCQATTPAEEAAGVEPRSMLYIDGECVKK